MSEIVYLRMKKNIDVTHMEKVRLQDIAYISTVSPSKSELEKTPIYRITNKDLNVVVVDSFLVVSHLNTHYHNLEFQVMGPSQSIIRIQKPKKSPNILLIAIVWLLLFIGAAMTIINFHYDVNMQEVQQKIHYLLTGDQNPYPLWIQIPYSFGLGIGMLLFFNHWFRKRINEEPSPLEIEIFNYQQDMDQYLTHYENTIDDTERFH